MNNLDMEDKDYFKGHVEPQLIDHPDFAGYDIEEEKGVFESMTVAELKANIVWFESWAPDNMPSYGNLWYRNLKK